MGYFGAFVLVLQIIRFSKAELKLEILRSFNGTEVPVSDVISEIVGSNIILTCKLVNTIVENNASNCFDSKLAWGWNRANVQFQNKTDLQELAGKSSTPLLQFLNKSDLNQAKIAFSSLSVSDSGMYFCMSLKHKLFHIVHMYVKGSKRIRKDNTPLRARRSNQKVEVLIPKNYCTTEMFICNSRTSCINYEYVCDSVIDCTDGSDENEYVCGSKPCKGKTKCSNGRCISKLLCCDYKQNGSCIFAPGPSCCSEVIRANKATYITSSNAINTIGLKNDEWTTYRRGFGGGEYNTWNDINNPAPKNSYGLVTKNRVNYNPKLNTSFTGTSRNSRKKVLWILLSPVIVIVIVIGTLAKMWQDKCKNVASNTENINRSFDTDVNPRIYGRGADVLAPEHHFRNLDLPPSYEEATR